jgi:hypothetical protein
VLLRPLSASSLIIPDIKHLRPHALLIISLVIRNISKWRPSEYAFSNGDGRVKTVTCI